MVPCRLPVSGALQGSAGFIQVPGGAFTKDPASDIAFPGAPDPSGLRRGYTYDPAAARWLPVPPDYVEPGLAWYVYVAADASVPRLHRVEVATGSDTLWPGGDRLQGYVTAARPEGIYGAPGPEILQLVDPTGLLRTVDQGRYGLMALVTATAYFETQWVHGSTYQLTDLVRVDAGTSTEQVWFHRAGLVVLPIGIDAHGSPIVAVGKQDARGRPVAQEIWIAPRPSTAERPTGTLVYSSVDQPLTILGQARASAGMIFFETGSGLYVWDGSALANASGFVGYVAGDCL